MSRKYKVRFSIKSQRKLQKMDKNQALIVMGWISKNLENTENPRQFGKALSGNYSGAWRYRIGDYRLIANIDDKEVIILILEVGHRKDIYIK